jgi:malate dehydrogenase (quinone)
MLTVLEKCFADRWADWQPTLAKIVPGYGRRLSDDPALAAEMLARTAAALHLQNPAAV